MRLHRYLVLHTAAWAAGILLIGALGVLASEQWAARRTAAELARTLERLLEMQLAGFAALGAGQVGFPDWPAVSRLLDGHEGCARLRRADGSAWRSECRGESARPAAPAAFVALHRALFAPGSAVVRPIEATRAVIGTLEWAPAARVEIEAGWRATTRLGGLIAVTVAALAVVVSLIASRALAPTTAILESLTRLAHGERTVRLAPARFIELARLADAVNALANTLQASEVARVRLANRLAHVQEDERRALARELHDEFGQHLAGIAGLAAALRHGSTDEALQAGARRIEDTVQALHGHLRSLLAALRPPGLDELGLAGALAALAHDPRRVPTTRIRVVTEGAIDTLPAPLAVHVYRIVQESITNALKHARPGLIAVRVARRPATPEDRLPADEIVEVAVDDDGSPAVVAPAEGHGRRGIAERASALLGRVAFDDGPRDHARVRVWLPVVST